MNHFDRSLSALRDARVEFVVVGGVAVAAHGSASLTSDLDICYHRSLPNIERLVEALQPHHPRLRGVPENVPFHFDAVAVGQGMNFTLTTDLGDFALFGDLIGIGPYSNVLALSETIELFGSPCPVLSLEGLIRTKRAAGRTKDLLVLPELETLREIERQFRPEPPSG